MAKPIWIVLVLALCWGCGGSTPPAEEPTSPSTSTEEENAPANEETPPEPAADETKDPAPASDDASNDTGAKKKCEELDKSTCKVTMGCGWNDVKKCVDTTLSE
jgi:hypothetical protein